MGQQIRTRFLPRLSVSSVDILRSAASFVDVVAAATMLKKKRVGNSVYTFARIRRLMMLLRPITASHTRSRIRDEKITVEVTHTHSLFNRVCKERGVRAGVRVGRLHVILISRVHKIFFFSWLSLICTKQPQARRRGRMQKVNCIVPSQKKSLTFLSFTLPEKVPRLLMLRHLKEGKEKNKEL